MLAEERSSENECHVSGDYDFDNQQPCGHVVYLLAYAGVEENYAITEKEYVFQKPERYHADVALVQYEVE